MVLDVQNGKPRFDEALLDYVRKGSIEVLQSFFYNDNSQVTDYSGSTLLHYAAESNNVSMTKYFIDSAYNLNYLDYDGNTPLMLAVQRGSIDTAKLLIKADADIYFQNFEGKSILPDRSEFKLMSRALYHEHDDSKALKKYRELAKSILEKVRKDCWNNEQLLISRLVDIDCSLINVICLRDANITRLMLQNGYTANDSKFEAKTTALHEAIELGDYENVKVLLEYGADVDALNEKGLSAIYSYFGDFSNDISEKVLVLKALIEHGALLTRPPERTIPTKFILATGKLWALKTLMQYDFEWDPYYLLHALVSNSDPDALEAVRGKNLDINSVHNPFKSPVLSLAAMLGCLKKVKFLLESGADPNIVDEGGHTPFTFPFRYLFKLEKGHLPIVRLMLQYGADAQFLTANGNTVFNIALEHQYEILLEPVIDHLAMMETLGHAISDLIRRQINSKDAFNVRFEICKRRLRRMKNMIIHDNVTLYKLLTESQSKVIRYTRNPEFAEKFKQEMKTKQFFFEILPYYAISLQKRVGQAINLTKLRNEAVIVMSEIIIEHRITDYDEMLSKIVDYLNNDDLKNLCKVSDLEETETFNLDTLFSLLR